MTHGLPGGVLIVGTGLIGTSIGLALRRAGVEVRLRDTDADALAEAVDLGAGVPDEAGAVGDDGSADDTDAGVVPAALGIVAVPPGRASGVVVDLLRTGSAEYVTDVASVKASIAAAVREAADEPRRYVGSHPMAGRELAGPSAALIDLFEGRPWVICPDDSTDQQAVARVLSVARLAGATPVTMSTAEHDEAVALVSHTPHVVSALVAGRLREAPAHEVRLAGPGIGDVTRVAGGDPRMWTEILAANAGAVRGVLEGVRDDLDRLLGALGAKDDDVDRDTVGVVLRHGVDGRSRLPGKHGAAAAEYATVVVAVDDRPGQLARLFADAGAAGVNVEDVRIDHSPGQPLGLVELDVRPGADGTLKDALAGRGWTVHGQGTA